MFSLVPRFSSSGFHHWVGRFFTRFPSKFSFNRFHAQRSSRLKREAIVITWPSKRKSRDNHHPGLPSLTSISTPLVWLPSKPRVLLNLRTRFLLILRNRFHIVYATGLAEHLCTSRKNIPLRYLSEIVHLSRYEVIILDRHPVTRSWVVGWTQPNSPLWCRQPRHQYWSEHWLDDERLPSVYHQV